jgi:GntR family transcriptional regulator
MPGAHEQHEQVVDWRSRVAVYRQVAEFIVRRIERGEFAPGDQIPSESELQGQYGIGRHTARHVVEYLRSEGWVTTTPHRGSYVAERPG